MKMLGKIILAATFLAFAPGVRADEVTDWNQNMLQATHVAGTSALLTTRIGALVQSAVFDALNGIEGKYQPIHVPANAPSGASRRAAVIQAAYAMLVHIYPAQKPTFDAELTSSLENLLEGGAADHDRSVARGLVWGQLTIIPSAANSILTWPTNFSGFTLQSATNLSSPIWTTNLPAPVVVNGMNAVTNPISGTRQFFRLRQ